MRSIKYRIIALLCVVMVSVNYVTALAESTDEIKDKIESNKML